MDRKLLVSLLLISCALAISSIEARNKASLYSLPGEIVLDPIGPVTCRETKYWVVPYSRGTEFSGMVVFRAESGELVDSETEAKDPIIVAYLYSLLEKFTESARFLRPSTIRSLESLKGRLREKREILSLLKKDFSDEPEVLDLISSLSFCYSSLESRIDAIKSRARAYLSLLEDFLRGEPACEDIKSLRDFDRAFQDIDFLLTKANECSNYLSSLKKTIQDANVLQEVKIQALTLLSPPYNKDDIDQIVADAVEEKDSLKKLFSKVLRDSEDFVNALGARISYYAFHEVYEGTPLRVGTYYFSSVKEAVSFIVNTTEQWQDKDSVSKLLKYKGELDSALARNDYGAAKYYAEKLRHYAERILQVGPVREEERPESPNYLPLIIGGVLIAIAVIVVLRGRKREEESVTIEYP